MSIRSWLKDRGENQLRNPMHNALPHVIEECQYIDRHGPHLGRWRTADLKVELERLFDASTSAVLWPSEVLAILAPYLADPERLGPTATATLRQLAEFVAHGPRRPVGVAPWTWRRQLLTQDSEDGPALWRSIL